jgi:beta-1,4-N-acetylglucosaminyltransferase
MAPDPERLEKYCLVTVGATVGFEELTKQVLHAAFWEFLSSQGFTDLHIQCGPDIPWASARVSDHKDKLPSGFNIDVFDVKPNLIKDEMVLCQAKPEHRTQGLVISHAGQPAIPSRPQQIWTQGAAYPNRASGTGTILDAWRMGLPLIVVPNTRLLNDHQTEMANHLAKEGYATVSSAK